MLSGELLDVTPSGFRIRYSGVPLPLGLEMEVLYSWGKVNAMVASVSQQPGMTEADILITG